MSGKSCPKCSAAVEFRSVLFALTPNNIRCRVCKANLTYRVGYDFLLVPLTIYTASIGATCLTWDASSSPTAFLSAFVGTLFGTAFVSSFLLAVYFRRTKTLQLADPKADLNEQDESMQNNSRVSERPLIVRIVVCILGIFGGLYLGLEVAKGISLFAQDWTADNLLKTVMKGAVFPLIGIFFIIEAFYYRFAVGNTKSIKWKQIFVYLYICVIVSMSLLGLVSLVGVLEEGRWRHILGPLAFLLTPFQAFVLLPHLFREMKKPAIANHEPSSLLPEDS